MTWWEAEPYARRGVRVRLQEWQDRWIVGDDFMMRIARVDRLTLAETSRVSVSATDFGAREFNARTWTLDEITAIEQEVQPLGTVTLADAFSPTLFSFGSFAAGNYRVVYEAGALYYVAGDKSQLRINAYSSSVNGIKIRTGGVDLNAPGYNADASDTFRYLASDPRSEAALLADIAARNAGREVVFTHAGGDISMWLSDDYTNNAASAVMPRFSLYPA